MELKRYELEMKLVVPGMTVAQIIDLMGNRNVLLLTQGKVPAGA
jgi:hypothetical protein